MSKFVKTSFVNTKEILKYAEHFVSVAVTVSDAGITADANGKKVVAAGTIIGGASAPVLSDTTQMVAKKNTQGSTGSSAEGVLLYDVDVTHGPAAGSMVVHGFINSTKLPETPCADALAALKQISFLK